MDGANQIRSVLYLLLSSSVLDDQQNVRPIKELLQMLYISLCGLVQDMGKSVLVGNINIWVHRMENIMQWQQQLDNIQINRVSIYPKMQIHKILLKFSYEIQEMQITLIFLTFPVFCFSAHIYRHDTDWPTCQSAVEHHAASIRRQGPGQPGPGVPRAGDPHWGPAAVEETLPVPLHRQTGT